MEANHTVLYPVGPPHVAAPSNTDSTPPRPTESARLLAAPAEIRRTLHLLCAPGDLHELRVLHVPAPTPTEPKREITRFGYFTDREQFADAAAAEDAPGIYFTLNPGNPALLKRADHVVRRAKQKECTSDEDIIRRRWLLIDADPKRERGSATVQEKANAEAMAQGVRAWLAGCGFSAPIFADSGNGFHLLYRVDLENTADTGDLVERFLKRLAGSFNTAAVTLDTSVSNASRICKLYGTVARKGPDTPDRPHRLSRLIDTPAPITVVPRALLEKVAGPSSPPTAPAPAPVRRAAPRLNPGKAHPAGDWLTLDVVSLAKAHGAYGKTLGNGKHAILCPWVAGHSVARDAEDSDTVIYEPSGDRRPGFKCQHDTCAHRKIRDLREVWTDFDAHCSAPWVPDALPPRASGVDQADAPEAGERPGIKVSDVQHREPVAEALAALLAANEPPVVFTQAGRLTEVHSSHDGPQLRTMGEAELRVRLSDVADFFAGRNRAVSPPRELLQSLLVRAPRFTPELTGISRIPIVRPDGSIRTEAGYDPVTCRLHDPHPDLLGLTLPEQPGRDAATAAAALLLDLVSDFPFETLADQAGYLALLLTLVARPALGLSPLALITAPAPGSGKGLLVSLVSEICTVAPPNLTSIPTQPEEWPKKITTLLLKAHQAVVFDNVGVPLSNPDLALMLTATRWNDRKLGGNVDLTLPNETVWVATGNNVTMSTEISQRCHRIRLRYEGSSPRLRNPDDFKYPGLLQHVRQHRAAALEAVLTLVRAWFVAGQPPAAAPTLGSFETWSGAIAGMLAFAGVPDFLGNLEAHYEEADDQTPELEVFLAALLEAFGEQAFTVGSVVFKTKESSQLRMALPEDLLAVADKDSALRPKMGSYFKRNAEIRPPSLRFLARAGVNSVTKAQSWKVLQAQSSAKGEDHRVYYGDLRRVTETSRSVPHFDENPHLPGTTLPASHVGPAAESPFVSVGPRDTLGTPPAGVAEKLQQGTWLVSTGWEGSDPFGGETGRRFSLNNLRDVGYTRLVTEHDEVCLLVRDEHRIPADLCELHRIPEAAAAEWLNAGAPDLEF